MSEGKDEGLVVELKFEERMMLSVLLTQAESNAVVLGIVRRFREKLSPDENEAKALGVFNTEDGRTGWNADMDKPVEYKIGEQLKNVVVDLLKRADVSSKLTLPQLVLYEKFIKPIEDGAVEDPE